MPVVRADLLPHQDLGAVFSAAPRPPPDLPQPAPSRLPVPSWPGVASDIPAAAASGHVGGHPTSIAAGNLFSASYSPRTAGLAQGSADG